MCDFTVSGRIRANVLEGSFLPNISFSTVLWHCGIGSRNFSRWSMERDKIISYHGIIHRVRWEPLNRRQCIHIDVQMHEKNSTSPTEPRRLKPKHRIPNHQKKKKNEPGHLNKISLSSQIFFGSDKAASSSRQVHLNAVAMQKKIVIFFLYIHSAKLYKAGRFAEKKGTVKDKYVWGGREKQEKKERKHFYPFHSIPTIPPKERRSRFPPRLKQPETKNRKRRYARFRGRGER